MTTTALLAVILGCVIAPVFTARAWVLGTGSAAMLCGLAAAAALLMGIALAMVAVKAGIR